MRMPCPCPLCNESEFCTVWNKSHCPMYDLWKTEKKENIAMNVFIGEGAKLPNRAHPTDAGMDIFTPEDVVVKAHGSATINSRVRIDLTTVPHIPGWGLVALILPKSGLNVKRDIMAFGVIDEPYRGEIVIKLYNFGDEDYHFHAGDKATQMVILPCMYADINQVDFLSTDTDRGTNGFGSSGL